MIPLMLLNAGLLVQPAPLKVTPEVAAKLQAIAYQAARDNDLPTLQAYFAAGQPVNQVNARGDTLLILATYYGHPDAVKLILQQKGVEVDLRNKMGLTALTGAAFKGELKIAEQLLTAKADINAANSTGQTALMFAAMTGRTEMVKFFLEKGANPKAADKSGKTALSLAQEQGAKDVVQLLEAALKK